MKIFDVIIIGSGAAGYSAADWLFKNGITDIAVITENRLWGTSRNTGSDKQTYYKISMDGISEDSPYKMAKDICALGCCDGIKAYQQAANSARCFMRLCDYGVDFPTDEFGGYPGYKTDHDSTSRATSVGPLTSRIMTQRLEDVVINKNRTPVFDNRQVTKIISENGRAAGITVIDTATGKPGVFAAKNIIAATGAPACIYECSVYPESQHGMTGVLTDAGARLCNYSQWQYGLSSVDFRWNVSGSFMQVIPRFVSIDKNGTETEFLTAYFSNADEAYSNVFLKGYQWPFSFDRAEFSSKIDIAVHNETKQGRQVYLDFTRNPAGFCFERLSDEAKNYLTETGATAETPIERLKKLNGKAIDVYARQGIDISREKLRIAVCAQHNNGGIYTDGNYETDIKGLYVIGEAAGSFGLTRPGGSALNDTQVGGLICAKHIKTAERPDPDINILADELHKAEKLAEAFTVDGNVDYSHVCRKMSNYAAFMRNGEKCRELLEKINLLIENYPLRHKSLSDYYYDLDMLKSASALLATIIGEMPLTGSRGGSVYTENGNIISENTDYRKYMTVTEGHRVYFETVSPIPTPKKPFEAYLENTEEIYE